MPRPKPASAVTFAVMNFVIGGLLLICAVCSGVDMMNVNVNGRDVTDQLRAFLNREIPGYTVLKIAGASLGFLLAGGLIAAGIGLLHVAQWGRFLAILCGLFGALHHISMGVLQVFYVNPALDRFFNQLFPPMFPINFSFPFKTVAWFNLVTQIGAVVYYLVMVIVLLTSGRAFARAAAAAADEEDELDQRRSRRSSRYEDEEYDDRPRRRRPPPRDEYYEDDRPRRPPRPLEDEDEDDRPRRRGP